MMRSGLNFVHGYGADVPNSVQSSGERLKELIIQHCIGPYEEDGVRIYVYLFVEGKTGPLFRFYGIRSDRPDKNGGILMVGAGIYISKVDWEKPNAEYRQFLWRNTEAATWACVKKLNKKKIAFDSDRLRQDLALVQDEFLGADAKLAELDSACKSETMPVDVYSEDEPNPVVIQYQIEGHGTMQDYDRRVKIESLLDELLSEADLGYLDGGDIGSGTANIFCFLKPGKKGTEAIIQTLRKNGYLDGAVIHETVKGAGKVVWPPEYAGEFRIC
jgi:hypothetical protein